MLSTLKKHKPHISAPIAQDWVYCHNKTVSFSKNQHSIFQKISTAVRE